MENFNYGIIVAMKEELEEVKKIMNNIEEINVYNLIFIKGIIGDKKNSVILVESGVGKVNAARVTQLLIDKFEVDIVINIGSGASANEELDIGDIVIGNKLVQHDFDITAFGHPKGFISNIGKDIECDYKLVNNMKIVISKLLNNEYKVKIGTIVSGDIFCTEINMKDKIRKKFNADVIDMESAAIAQVCKLDNKPFLIIRSISDKPDGNNQITFDEFLRFASKRCAIILEKFINNKD